MIIIIIKKNKTLSKLKKIKLKEKKKKEPDIISTTDKFFSETSQNLKFHYTIPKVPINF